MTICNAFRSSSLVMKVKMKFSSESIPASSEVIWDRFRTEGVFQISSEISVPESTFGSNDAHGDSRNNFASETSYFHSRTGSHWGAFSSSQVNSDSVAGANCYSQGRFRFHSRFWLQIRSQLQNRLRLGSGIDLGSGIRIGSEIRIGFSFGIFISIDVRVQWCYAMTAAKNSKFTSKGSILMEISGLISPLNLLI